MAAPLAVPSPRRRRLASRGAALLLVPAGLLGLLAFRTPRPVDFDYVLIVGPGSARVSVTICSWSPGARVSLAGDESLLGVKEWRFLDSEGRGLHDEPVLEAVAGAKSIIVQHRPQAQSGPVVATFEIDPPSRREFDGRLASRLGGCGPDYAVLQGIHFLLMPHGFDAGTIRLRIETPPGWRPVASSPIREWRGRHPFDLVSEVAIVGPFREEIPGRLFLHESYPDADRAALRAAFLAGPESGSPAVLGPRLPDEVPVECLPGGGLVFLDVTRDYPRLRAELARAQFETEVHPRLVGEPSESWFAVGAGEWVAEKALNGLQKPGVLETHAAAYEANRGWDLGIDAMPPEVVDRRFWNRVRRTKAAVIFGLLARAVGREAIDCMITEWRQGRSWEQAVSARLGAQAGVRCRDWLRGGGLPLRRRPDMRMDPGSASSVGVEFGIAFTGDGEGFIETCGCNLAAAGGLARRAQAIASARERIPALLSVELGNFLTLQAPRRLDPVVRAEQKLQAELLALMGTDVAVVADAELQRGRREFDALAGSLPVVGWGVPGIPAFRVVERAGLRIAIVGFSPSRHLEDEYRVFGEAAAECSGPESMTGLDSVLSQCRRTADLVVVAGRFTPSELRSILDRSSEHVDLVLNADIQAREGAPLKLRTRPGGFEGRTLVLFHVFGKQGVSFARIRAVPGRVLSFGFEPVKLDDAVGEDPDVRRRIDEFYASLGSGGGHTETTLFPGDPWARRPCVDESRCISCHSSEHLQWAGTKHAKAFDTLIRAQRQNHASCVKCHVVGFGSDGGYRMEQPDPRLRNVGCQVCHGGGGDHAAAPSRRNIRRTPDKGICMGCHDPKHSPDFEATFHRRWDSIRH